MSDELADEVGAVLGASSARLVERVQTLWSGYGAIWRVALEGHEAATVIAKHVAPPREQDHPRGWSSDHGHARKVESYRVEHAWYAGHAARCNPPRLPRALHLELAAGRGLFVLEDLDAAGFAHRHGSLDPHGPAIDACLRWLAEFHAKFLAAPTDGLWSTGTYWHLATRPDELAAMVPGPLRDAAPALDAKLREARHQTLVHGDAKVANFCFAPDGHDVAAVDFQYVGGGVGVQDVAYFFSSCLREHACEAHADRLLDRYFELLRGALKARGEAAIDPVAVEAEWRVLYPIAWADFVRFLEGWAPSHRKLHGYSLRVTREALARLG